MYEVLFVSDNTLKFGKRKNSEYILNSLCVSHLAAFLELNPNRFC